jgi:hypothetical protein
VELADGRLDPEARPAARRGRRAGRAGGSGWVSRRPSSRSRAPTGAGKSSLFNAVAGGELVRAGAAAADHGHGDGGGVG